MVLCIFAHRVIISIRKFYILLHKNLFFYKLRKNSLRNKTNGANVRQHIILRREMNKVDKMQGVYPLQQVVAANPPVAESRYVGAPQISSHAVLGAGSMVIGPVTIEKDVFVGFHNVIRADASYPYFIGRKCNIQDFVLIHCHPAEYVRVGDQKFGVYIDEEVSMLHHAVPHGPLYIGRNTFVGQQVSIYGAIIGQDCVLMHNSTITGKVKIGDGRFVGPGVTVHSQEQADALPQVPAKYRGLNAQIVDYYFRLGKSYQSNTALTQ